MNDDINKKWLAVEDGEIKIEASTKEALLDMMETEKCPTCGERTLHEYEIVAVPETHRSMFV